MRVRVAPSLALLVTLAACDGVVYVEPDVGGAGDAAEGDASSDVPSDSCVDNGCGGCVPLPLLGGACGPCGLDAYVCDGAERAVCGGATACPLGAPCETDSDCASGSCSEESEGTENDRCVPRLFAGTTAQMDFSYIPPGTFQMGSPPTEVGYRDDDEAQVLVMLTGSLAVMRTEVTQAQWKRATGSTNPSEFTACGDSCPVERVDWHAAAAYANWLSANDGDPTTSECYVLWPSTCADSVSDWADGFTGTDAEAPVEGESPCRGAEFAGVACTGYRLLTEAEWEYAARAGTTTATYWDGATSRPTGGSLQAPFDCGPQPNLEPVAWYCGNSGDTTHEVAQLFPNAWGLYDMLGNVWEWTTDWYTSSLPGGSNPINAFGSNHEVYRGGSWYQRAGSVRAAVRAWFDAEDLRDAAGFRLCRSLP